MSHLLHPEKWKSCILERNNVGETELNIGTEMCQQKITV